MDIAHLLLRTGLRHFIDAPNAEAALAEIEGLSGTRIDPTTFADAIAALLHDGLIRDPVRLEEHALQCHWRLELTPRGVDLARTLTGA